MTTGQLAKRLNVQQPRVIELEKGEANGKITVQSLERAAEALGCRLVYVLIPHKPLTEIVEQRALQVAERQLSSVEQTMRLEAQGVNEQSSLAERLSSSLPTSCCADPRGFGIKCERT